MSKIRDQVAEKIREAKESGKEYDQFVIKVALTPPEYNQFVTFHRNHLMAGTVAGNDREFGGAEPGRLALQPNVGMGAQGPDASVIVELPFRYNEEPPDGFTPTDAPIAPDFEGLGVAAEARRVVFGVDFHELP